MHSLELGSKEIKAIGVPKQFEELLFHVEIFKIGSGIDQHQLSFSANGFLCTKQSQVLNGLCTVMVDLETRLRLMNTPYQINFSSLKAPHSGNWAKQWHMGHTVQS